MNAAFCGVTPMVRLGDLAAGPDAFADGPFGSNLKGDHYTDQGARVIRLGNIGRGEFLAHDAAFVTMRHFATLSRHHVRAGDVVVAALGDGARPAGRACRVPDGLGPAMVKADCFRVRLPASRVDPDYIVFCLNSPASLAAISGAMRGATRPRVNLSILRDASVPLPSLSEQKRIVVDLGGQLREAGRARVAVENKAAEIDHLPAAILRSVFSPSSG
jgi:type I restriction enzyme S subunit